MIDPLSSASCAYSYSGRVDRKYKSLKNRLVERPDDRGKLGQLHMTEFGHADTHIAQAVGGITIGRVKRG